MCLLALHFASVFFSFFFWVPGPCAWAPPVPGGVSRGRPNSAARVSPAAPAPHAQPPPVARRRRRHPLPPPLLSDLLQGALLPHLRALVPSLPEAVCGSARIVSILGPGFRRGLATPRQVWHSAGQYCTVQYSTVQSVFVERGAAPTSLHGVHAKSTYCTCLCCVLAGRSTYCTCLCCVLASEVDVLYMLMLRVSREGSNSAGRCPEFA